jgi:hypothetical protein
MVFHSLNDDLKASSTYVQRIFHTKTRPMCFVFCRLYPFSHSHPWQCLGPTSRLSTVLITSTIANLSIHMMGEVSCDPKRRRAWVSVSLLVINPLCLYLRAYVHCTGLRTDFLGDVNSFSSTSVICFIASSHLILFVYQLHSVTSA